MHIDKKLLHRLFFLVAGSIVFAWLVLDTARATVMFKTIWELFSPFAVGAGIAFVFNEPMRAIEKQLDGIRKTGLRRGFAIVLTILCLVLIIMFVVEMLVPQIGLTIDSLRQTIPAFVERTASNIIAYLDENHQSGKH